MATFVSISGPTSTGKTSLIRELSMNPELSNVKFVPDLYNSVWSSFVERGLFQSYDDIIKDSEFLCVYIHKLIEQYNDYIEEYKDYDGLVILDCCWIDILVYSLLNMWYSKPLKTLQEDILRKIMKFNCSVDRIYLTRLCEIMEENTSSKSIDKIHSIRSNRSLELSYYDMISNFGNVCLLGTDPVDNVSNVLNDLKYLGYL